MQGQHSHGEAYYRCRYAQEYACAAGWVVSGREQQASPAAEARLMGIADTVASR